MSQTLWACHILGPTLFGLPTLARGPQEKGGEPAPWLSPQQLFKAAGPAAGSRHHGTQDTAAGGGDGLASESTACAPNLLLQDADPEP